MTMSRSASYLAGLVRELCKLPHETEWAEFKVDNDDPQAIGEYISALANSAALAGKTRGYLLWGVRDSDHALVGTRFEPKTAKRGNEELESWLLRLLNPRIDFRFFEALVADKRVVLLEIDRASHHPVTFRGVEYIRVGSNRKKLKEYPEKERALWRIFDRQPFEEGVADERLSDAAVLQKLDYPAYFDLMQAPLPDGRAAILDALIREGLVRLGDAGGYNITNLGAVLFARRLDDFPSLRRKALRVIQYRGRGRTETLREQVGGKGYGNGFEGLLSFINGLVPANEVVGQALRRDVPMFPPLAVRELVANALIHQDFSATGTGPMVELFEDRVEITNPGEPLVATERFLDSPPTSRNEALASLMRRLGICEERGSGIDKVVAQVELYQLPGPLFEVPPNFTRVVLFSYRALSDMGKEDRVWACYLHACLKYVQRDYLTNTSLRERLGIEEHNRAVASRVIRDAVAAGLIAPHDPGAGPKYMKYVPAWAAGPPTGRP
jgi:predicted HTH transcriptional regulator